MTMTFAELMFLSGMKSKMGEVDVDDLVNLFSSALTGSGWCGVDNSGDEWDAPEYADDCIEETMAKMLLAGKPIRFYDVEDPDERWTIPADGWTLAVDMLDNGTNVFLTKYPHLFRQVIHDGCLDGETGDALFQCILLGDIVYG